jgi:endoglucanase
MLRRTFLPLSVLAIALQSCLTPPGYKPAAANLATPKFVGEPKNGNEVPENRYLVVDQFGYRPDMKKVAILVDPQVGWNASDEYVPGDTLELRRFDDGGVVMSGTPQPWRNGDTQVSSGDRGSWFDFSAVTTAGSYFIFDRKNGVRSVKFDIDKDVYRNVLKAAVRMFYFNRSNFAKAKPFACVGDKCWLQGVDYMGPGQDKEAHSVLDRDNDKTARDLSGGWWDAGDTDKYTTFTYSVMHQLLTAYEENPRPFTDDFNIPESGNGLPDVIDEIQYELDFLKKMQAADLGGGALVKVGNVDYGDPVPEESKFKRYYYPEPCSAATVTLAGVFAHAALTLSKFDRLKDYAEDLRKRALSAWAYYGSHPKSDACDDGTIKSGDADVPLSDQDARAVVAAIYLYALTGDKQLNTFIDQNRGSTRPFKEDRWSIYDAAEGDAFLFYTTLPNADPELKKTILDRKELQWKTLDFYGMKPDKDLYRAFMREDSYHWGSNNPRANFGSTNYDMVQYKLLTGAQADGARDRAAGILNSFHGVNPMQLVYLSNMSFYGAERSCNEIYHTWFRDGDKRWDSAKDSELGPAPGYVPGGPNKSYCATDKDHKCYRSEFRKQPAQKAYMDFNTSYEPTRDYDMSWALTEPAIYYQAAYVKLLSKFVE